MIGIDTNVLVRIVIGDNPEQQGRVMQFLSERNLNDPAFVSSVTLMEMIWILKRRYGYAHASILNAVRHLLYSPEFHVEHQGELAKLLDDRDASGSDIADTLVASAGRRAGCSHTFTFDRRAARSIPSMELLT